MNIYPIQMCLKKGVSYFSKISKKEMQNFSNNIHKNGRCIVVLLIDCIYKLLRRFGVTGSHDKEAIEKKLKSLFNKICLINPLMTH